MPTVENLDRLQGIVARLRPLAETRRGELIRADDWNAVVGALLELARAVLTTGTGEVPVHSHDEQVALPWLDAQLRALLQEGPLADPRSVARVAALERRLDRADTDLGAVRETVGSLRDRVGDVATRDVAREADLTALRIQVEGTSDSRRDVLALRSALDAIRTDVQRAVELGAGLVVDGQPLDVAGLERRVSAVEELRERLTRDDGELLDAAAFERRLAEYGASVVTVEQLDAALKRLRPRIGEEQVAAIRQDVLAAASAQLDSSLGSLRAELSGQVDARLADVDSRIGNAVSSAVPGIREEVIRDAQALVMESSENVMNDARALVEHMLRGAIDDFAGRVDERMRSYQEAIGSEFNERFDSLARELEPVRDRVAELSNEVSTYGGAFEDLRGHVASLSENVGALRDRMEALVAEAVDRRIEEATAGYADRMREIAREEDQAIREELVGYVRKIVPAYVDRAMSSLPDRFARDFEERGPLFEVFARFVDERTQPR
ncbi:MAG TPA: hypothetical protein VF519_00140 [Mycobacteriales bacterium]|jgi:hypothetical protein